MLRGRWRCNVGEILHSIMPEECTNSQDLCKCVIPFKQQNININIKCCKKYNDPLKFICLYKFCAAQELHCKPINICFYESITNTKLHPYTPHTWINEMHPYTRISFCDTDEILASTTTSNAVTSWTHGNHRLYRNS